MTSAGWHAVLSGEARCVCGHDFVDHIWLGEHYYGGECGCILNQGLEVEDPEDIYTESYA